MGELDKRQKLYFGDANRFADLWNALMFDGEQIILPEELEEADSVQDIVLKNNSMERIADLIRKRRKNGEILAIMILENQGKTNPDLRSLIGLYKRKNNARAFGEFAREVAKDQELDESGAMLLAELINNKRLLRKLEKIKKKTIKQMIRKEALCVRQSTTCWRQNGSRRVRKIRKLL